LAEKNDEEKLEKGEIIKENGDNSVNELKITEEK
jgi:hypothetical protein